MSDLESFQRIKRCKLLAPGRVLGMHRTNQPLPHTRPKHNIAGLALLTSENCDRNEHYLYGAGPLQCRSQRLLQEGRHRLLIIREDQEGI